ncbi:actin-related protein 2/3 complex subunit 5-B-like [Dreissena polymorpha]|uniref:actin-related protein 2/3 complex subunit 5-B-like n=1 Tax=Dreissena polymorpha TaxID=45954 RepID=UPI0022649D5D|nr:actin-related protein 2/3 complex subunit 5-B-like [Dreissena polymorpha]
MSKTVNSTKFRKVNIDDFDPEKYADDTEEGEEQGPSEAEVNTLLTQGKNEQALDVILRNAPVASKSQAVKDRAVNLAIRVLTTFKAAEIDGAVKKLDTQMLDVLMKYVYRGFEFPSEGSSASLLTWHEKVFDVGGSGCIVRVLTDRKHV